MFCFLNKKSRYFIFLFYIIFVPVQALSLQNLITKKKEDPKNIQKKHWLLLAQNCHSCMELLTSLKTLCPNKKISAKELGFFTTGSSPAKILKKLQYFKTAKHEIFHAPASEFYKKYKISAAPSLKPKNTQAILIGKIPILKFLKKQAKLCSS